MLKFSVNNEKAIELGLLLKITREKLQFSTQDVSKLSGVSSTDINDLENGKRMRINPYHLVQLAKIYEINIIDLYRIIDYIDNRSIEHFIIDQKINEEFTTKINELKQKYPIIPVYTFENGILDSVSGFIQIPTTITDPCAFFMPDKSMVPLIEENSLILYKNADSISNGQIGIFYLNGTIIVRKYYINDTSIILISHNPSILPIVLSSKINLSLIGICYEIFNSRIIE